MHLDRGLPLNLGERITRKEDLSLVCSNCHRMLHRKTKEGNYLKVSDLERIVKNGFL